MGLSKESRSGVELYERIAKIEADLIWLKYFMGADLALVMALFVKIFLGV